MSELYGHFFEALESFRRLRIGDLFPDMSKSDCMTLMSIDYYNQKKTDGVLTVSELAGKMHVKPSAVSRTLKSLEERGLITRMVNQSNRRNTFVEISEEGRKKQQEMKAAIEDVVESVLKRIEEDDLRKLIAYLNEVSEIAVEEIELRKNKQRKELEHGKDI